MPNTPSIDTAIDMLMKLQARLDRIENAPQVGNTSIRAGALQILDSTGHLVMSLGYQPDGTLGLATYNPASGIKVIDIGQQTDGTMGLAMYDPTGVKLLELGQLAPASAAYGLTVRNAAGTMQQVAGILGDFAAGSQSTASGTLVSFSDGPTVTATIGPSGQALVSIGAYILTSTAGVRNDVVAAVDGVVPRDGGGIPLLDIEGLTSTYGQAVIGGLTPGSHVFTHQYYAGGATTATYLHRQLTVVPL
jgi:hypothetical protein